MQGICPGNPEAVLSNACETDEPESLVIDVSKVQRGYAQEGAAVNELRDTLRRGPTSSDGLRTSCDRLLI